MMIMKKTLSLLLAVIMTAMTFTVFPITANAVEVYAAGTAVDQTFTINNAEDLSAAVSEINAATTETSYVIDLRTDLNDCGIDIQNEAKVKVTVTIIGNGHTLSTTTHTLVYVDNGATVNIGDGESALTIQGDDLLHPDIGNDDLGLVYVLSDSTCNMRDKVTLKNRRGDNCLGGGVSVQGGTFIMDGGTIDNCGVASGSVCYGGGVAVYAGGTFTMNGGTISNCYAITDYIEERPLYQNCYAGMGGGVFVSDGSAFTMNGGTITNNTATNFGGGVAMTLADTEVKIDPDTGKEIIDPDTGKGTIDLGNPRSRAAINGGTISGNNAKNGAGVFASGLIFAYTHTLATGQLDTGDQLEPGLFINGGENKAVEISSNKADEMGGGVLAIGIKDPKRVDIKNTEISDNKAVSGAGVCVYKYWTKATIENCHIHDNTATALGGGIYLEDNKDNGAGTTVKNTVVEKNTAGEKGGGIYYSKGSVLNIEGSDTIQSNTVDEKDNNLYFQGTEHPVNVTGSLEGSKIGITDARLFEDNMEDYDPEAQSSLRLTEGFKAQNPSLVPETAFTSDHESWYVDYGDLKYKEVASDEDYYTYKGQKYEVVSRTDSGESCAGDLFFVKANLFETGIAENPTVFKNEVLSRFNDTSKYTAGYNDGTWYDFTNIATGDLVTICFPNVYNARIYLNDPGSYYNSNILIATSTGHQAKYADSGEFVFQYYYAATYDNIVYSNSPTPVDIHRNELIEQNEEIYEYDELGHITSKTVISNPPAKTPHQVETVLDYDYTDEVRLVHRTKIDYHINNEDIDDKYNDNDIFTLYVEQAINKDVKVGDTIGRFYTIPEVVPTQQNSCPYIFKGWYYDQDNDNDSHPVQFDTDKYAKDIYAHWIKVEDVAKDEEDTYSPPESYQGKYGGFDLAGVQIRKEMRDYNFDNVPKTPGGLRFITSLSMDVVDQINAIKPNNIEYGYVAAKYEGTGKAWIDYHNGYEKLQYVSTSANGIDTSSAKATDKNYFGFAHNVKCTSRIANSQNNEVRVDHQNFGNYLLYSFVVTYEGEDASGKGIDVLARPYIHYTDANGSERVAYSEYRGTSNIIGGCRTSYNTVADMAGN